ncbi:c-type cytochrome [Nitratireductor thuwali]|uniref:Alcohol dehydrogenase cytochrome c subunit n=1 Tax=Nitratireductor thuwali TaxID=2267699 RepID=A0ABY5MPK2_9HYPH|nr:Alcohol dehydrogenase cytochrome c subunit [Nitratireductor thuwali]
MNALTGAVGLAILFGVSTFALAQDGAVGDDQTNTRKLSDYEAMFADPSRIGVTGGEEVYRAICQGCHMPDGEGAVGAGAYPPLADNENLEFPEYPIYIIINGQRAMPPLGEVLDDQQIADVVNYIQTHFGNEYGGDATAEMVAQTRP